MRFKRLALFTLVVIQLPACGPVGAVPGRESSAEPAEDQEVAAGKAEPVL